MPEKSFLAFIGGAFVYSENHNALADWYSKMLGINWEKTPDGSAYYACYYYNELDSGKKTYIGLSIIHSKTRIPRGDGKSHMVNYRINDLKNLVDHLRANGVAVKGIDKYPEGDFAWCKDPDGNEMELWEDTNMK
jgi:predicted enzyme related to lactoylglutathione lyase